MAEEKIVKINLRKQLKSIPRWRRKSVFAKILKKRINNKTGGLKISQKLNEKIWHNNTPKIRLKLVKDDKLVKAEVVE